MSQDELASLITRARCVLGRVERQKDRFLYGRTCATTVTTRRGPWLGGNIGRSSGSGLNRRAGSRKKEASGAKEGSLCGQRYSRTNRPSWLCVPQCSRRSVVGRNERSRRSFSVPSARRLSGPVFRAPCARSPLDDSDVESILLRDRKVDDKSQWAKPPEEFFVAVDGSLRSSCSPAPKSAPTPTRTLTCLSQDDSNVSVNTFVTHQVRDIMDRAAMNVVSMKSEDDDGSQEVATVKRLRHQILRAATYTAVCRRLEHALHLYGETIPYKIPSVRPSLAGSFSRYDSDNARIRRAETYRSTRITDLPKNALLAIFAYLDQKDLALRVAPVCRQWRYLAHHRSLWRHIFLDWSDQKDNGIRRIMATCALLASVPGLWTLELVGCGEVERLLWQVTQSCRRLRTLTVDSCIVSESMKSTPPDVTPCVLTELLTRCKVLHTLIVAFTPHLPTPSFFVSLGVKSWSMRCFLVSAEVSETRLFFESASWHAPGSKSRSAVGGARAAILHNRATEIRREEDPGVKNRSALLQWRLFRDYATATYYGVNVRVSLSESHLADYSPPPLPLPLPGPRKSVAAPP